MRFIRHRKTVLVSEEDWSAIQETLYLLSVPGMCEEVDTPLDDCFGKPNW